MSPRIRSASIASGTSWISGTASRISPMRSALADILEKSIDIFARFRIGL